MPTISMFFGIVIRMFADDHNPPHFHASYQDSTATFTLEGDLIEGEMPLKQQKLISAWAQIHFEELCANWELAKQKETIFSIKPLQ